MPRSHASQTAAEIEQSPVEQSPDVGRVERTIELEAKLLQQEFDRNARRVELAIDLAYKREMHFLDALEDVDKAFKSDLGIAQMPVRDGCEEQASPDSVNLEQPVDLESRIRQALSIRMADLAACRQEINVLRQFLSNVGI